MSYTSFKFCLSTNYVTVIKEVLYLTSSCDKTKLIKIFVFSVQTLRSRIYCSGWIVITAEETDPQESDVARTALGRKER
jgi:hypothetical protein